MEQICSLFKVFCGGHFLQESYAPDALETVFVNKIGQGRRREQSFGPPLWFSIDPHAAVFDFLKKFPTTIRQQAEVLVVIQSFRVIC